MAICNYSDPYDGWVGRDGYTAHEIMTDTSMRWSLAYDFSTYRIYRSNW